MSLNGVEVIPGARRLIRSLRDMGYEFSAAVADIVDNSIEAKASVVRIDIAWNGEHSHVHIADNGKGMSAADLREAMRYGAEREYDTEDLGKFGLGLKTASLSQCSKLTVASRWNPNRVDINAYCWDFGHIEATNRWEILPVAGQALHSDVRQHLKETTGTVVIWERLDRVLGYKRPDGEHARKQLMVMCRELEEHLAMVFHRFLAGEVRGKRLSIYLNNNKIVPWDPFARSEAATQKLDDVAIRVESETAKTDVILEPFVLPAQSKFSSPEAHARASGPHKWNRQQGFYIYRADRMIQSGGWSGIRTLDEHLKLARVALNFSPRLDEAFKINVPKMRVTLPASIRDDITKALAPVMRLANSAYRTGEKPAASSSRTNPTARPSAPSTSSAPITRSNGSSGVLDSPDSPVPFGNSAKGSQITVGLEEVGALLERIALPEELPIVQRVIARARSTYGI